MIIGRVNENYEIVIPVVLPDMINRDLHEFTARIDTGLEYFLALPRDIVERLGFPIHGTVRLTMGNEQPYEFDRAVVAIAWDGVTNVFRAVVSETEILVGAWLLAGYYLTAAMVPGGRVTLTRLPGTQPSPGQRL